MQRRILLVLALLALAVLVTLGLVRNGLRGTPRDGARLAAPATAGEAASAVVVAAPEQPAITAPDSRPRASGEPRRSAAIDRAELEEDAPSESGPDATPVASEAALDVAAAEISGQVRTPGGYTLPGVMISAAPERRGKGARKLWARTDLNGLYVFRVPDLPELAYRVQVAGSSEDRALRRLIQTLKRQGGLQEDGIRPGESSIDFEVPLPGLLSLIVVDAHTHLAVPKVGVEWRPSAEEEFQRYGQGHERFTPGEAGWFTIGFPAGQIDLRISAAGYGSLEGTFEVLPEGAAPLVVELVPTARVTVRIVMPPGVRPSRFNPDMGPFELRGPDGNYPFPCHPLLLTEEEWERYEEDSWSGDWREYVVTNFASMRMQNRIFERSEESRGTVFVAHPEPGRYRIAAWPNTVRFDPDTITVGEEDLDLRVDVTPLEDGEGDDSQR